MAKKINVDLEQLEALAAKGYSITMCLDAIGISSSKAYADKAIMEAIKAGQSKARQKVVNDLMSRSEDDQSSTASIFLAKSLKVFSEYFPTASPKTPQDALHKISDIYTAVSKNTLSEDKGTALIGYLEKYIKAYEVTEVEKRLAAVEKVLNEK